MDPNDNTESSRDVFARLEVEQHGLTFFTATPYSALLEDCRDWILGEGKATGSAEVLKSLLESLAAEKQVTLADVRVLGDEQRRWFISLLSHLDEINYEDLWYAAGWFDGSDDAGLLGGVP